MHYAASAVGRAEGIDDSVPDGKFSKRNAGGTRNTTEPAAVRGRKKDYVGSAFNGEFDDIHLLPLGYGHRVEIAPVLSQVVTTACPEVDVPDYRFAGKAPPGITYTLPPVKPVQGRIIGKHAAGGREGAESAEVSEGIRLNKGGRPVLAAAESVDLVTDGGETVIGVVELLFRSYHLHRHKRPAGAEISRPLGREAVEDALESRLEPHPGGFFNSLLEIAYPERVAHHVVEVALREEGVVVIAPGAADHDIAGRIVVGGVVTERTMAPAPVVAVIVMGEGIAVVLQELRAAPAAGRSQRRLHDHGVSFQERRVRIDSVQGAGPHLAEHIVEPVESPPVGKLHLGDVARLVDDELGRARKCTVRSRLLHRIEGHPLRGPDDDAVRVDIVGVKNRRKAAPLEVARGHADGFGDDRAVFFKKGRIEGRQAVAYGLRIYQAVIGGYLLVPFEGTGVFAFRRELGLRRETPRKECRYGQYKPPCAHIPTPPPKSRIP